MTALPPALSIASAPAEHPAQLILWLGALALLPSVLVVLTSFLKMTIVLSVTRSALGAPQIPPSSAITGLALLLSVIVMAPVAEEGWRRAQHIPAHDLAGSLEAASAAAEPLRQFLSRFARPEDQETFLALAQRAHTSAATSVGATAPTQAAIAAAAREVRRQDFAVLAPAFVVSELRRSFTMGFIIFLPFLVVDLLVASVLLALGFSQLSPTTVALPFKLLLFVAVDGWRVLAQALVLGYLA